MPRTLVNDLVDERCREVVFGTSFVQVVKVRADTNGALFLENRNGVRNPSGVFDGVNETSLLELIDFGFNSVTSGRMNGSHLLADWFGVRPGVDMMLDNGRIESGHFRIGPGEDIAEFFEKLGVSFNFFRGALGTQCDVFFDSWCGRNVNFDGRRDIGHVSFFESIRCRDGVFEPIDCMGNEVFGFHSVLVMGLLWEEICAMVHIIPGKVGVGHGFHDVFIRLEDGKIGGRWDTRGSSGGERVIMRRRAHMGDINRSKVG